MATSPDQSVPNAPSQTEIPEKGSVLYQALIDLCGNNAGFFEGDQSESGQKLRLPLTQMLKSLPVVSSKVEEIRRVAPKFDFDESIPHNGYRSVVSTVDSSVTYCLKLSRQILVNRGSYFFRKTHYVRELENCAQMLDSLNQILDLNLKLLSWTDTDNLFAMHKSREAYFEEIYIKISRINLDCFFGRPIGFQFTESLQQVMKTLGIMLASFSEVYYSDGNSMLARATNSAWHSSKYLLDPELRAKRIVRCTFWASVEFCKAFWFLGEIELMSKVPNLVYSAVAVNRLITLSPEPLQIVSMNGTTIDIPIPFSYLDLKPLNVRLITKHVYQGMMEDSSPRPSKTAPVPRSSELIFHCHGGGFVAQSSRSHEMYLREWAIYLNCPIVSVDYSLAPQAPFPRALEEVLYAYCWTLNNASQLGSTAEKIIFAGDSAGANLSLSLAFKCVELGVRPPDGIFLAYAPVLISFLPSPARLLSLLDPILPIGFLSACLRAYAHPKSVEDMHKYEHKLKRISTVKVTDSNVPIVASPIEKPETVIMDMSPVENRRPLNSTNESPTKKTASDCDDISDEKVISTVPLESLPAQPSKKSVEQSPDLPPVEVLASVSSMTSSNSVLMNTIQQFKDGVNDSCILASSQSVEKKLPVESKPSIENLTEGRKEGANGNGANKVDGTEKNGLFADPPIVTNGTKSEVEANDETNAKLRPEFSRAVESVTTAITNVFANFTKTNYASPKIDPATEALDEEEASIPVEFFNVQTPEDHFLSPILAPDELLKSLPPVKLLTTEMDPFLDDCVSFGKKLKELGNDVSLDVLPGLPHGFLTFALINKDANEGSELCCRRIRELFDMPVEEGRETDHMDAGLMSLPDSKESCDRLQPGFEPIEVKDMLGVEIESRHSEIADQSNKVSDDLSLKPLSCKESTPFSTEYFADENVLTIGLIEKDGKQVKNLPKETKLRIYTSANSSSEKSTIRLSPDSESEITLGNEDTVVLTDKCARSDEKTDSSNAVNIITIGNCAKNEERQKEPIDLLSDEKSNGGVE